MKRKHLFMTMALAAGFAACTSEDVIETSNTNEAARKVLDNIEFTLGEVDSRFTLESGTGWGFNEGDAFGAALVDVYNGGTYTDAIKNYNLTGNIQSNYQYAKGEGNSWTTPARMVEGNYVFYAPFNEKHLSRKPIEVITPIAQTLDVNEDGTVDTYSAINNAVAEGNPFFLAYEFLPAVGQETSLSLDFYSIFAYPKVTIKNNKTEDVTLTKVVIKTANKFSVKGSLKVGTADAYAKAGAGVVGKLFNYGTYDKVKNPHGAWVVNNEDSDENGLVGETDDILTNVTAQADVIVVDIPNTLEIPAGESVSFNVVMPADTYTAGIEVLAYISADEGYVMPLANKSMTLYPNKLYPKEEYKNDNTLNQSKKGSMFTATIGKNEPVKENLASAFPVLVSTTAELEAAILEGNSTLYVIPTSDEVAINEDVFDAMRKSQFQGMTVAGDIKIVGSDDEDEPLEINENITIEGTATVSGCVKTHEYNVLNDVVVTEDAVFTVASTEAMAIKNNGTTNINVKESAATVENYGTLNLNKGDFAGSIAEGTTKNAEGTIIAYHGTVNVEAENVIANTAFNATWNINEDAEISAAATIGGTMTIATGKTLETAGLTINGDGTLTVDGSLHGVVKLNGVKDADSNTTGDQTKYAKLYLNSTSFLRHNFEAASGSEYAPANLVYVKKGASFFSQTGDKDNVTSWFEHTGNLTGDTYADLKVPAQCNSLKIVGNVIPDNDQKTMTINGSNLEYTLIEGDILVGEGYNVTINGTELKVDGDVVFAEQTSAKECLTGTDLTKMTITGKLEINKNSYFTASNLTGVVLNDVDYNWVGQTFDIASAAPSLTTLEIGGTFATKENVECSIADLNVILNDTEVIMASGKYVRLTKPTVHMIGDVKVSGGEFMVYNVQLYNDAVWTIAKDATVNTLSSFDVIVTRVARSSYGGAVGSTMTGKVVNNGVVEGSIAYGDADNADADVAATAKWWSGNEAI